MCIGVVFDTIEYTKVENKNVIHSMIILFCVDLTCLLRLDQLAIYYCMPITINNSTMGYNATPLIFLRFLYNREA